METNHDNHFTLKPSTSSSLFRGSAHSVETKPLLDEHQVHADRRRKLCGVEVSALGIGTYLGGMDHSTDTSVTKAVVSALSQGVTLIDTAINYRGQRGERAVGEALRQLILKKSIKRDSVFISTKGGFVPYDGEPVRNLSDLFQSEYVAKRPSHSALSESDFVAQCHCMHPDFLENQLDRSRKNLGVDTIDLYYLHNPETQLEEYPERIFLEKLFDAFSFLERARSQGKIRAYGLATWDGFREVKNSQSFLDLQKIVEVATAASRSSDSGFKAIQLPFNFAMLEARFLANQVISEPGGETVTVSAIEAAVALGLDVVVSSPLLQGQLAGELPPFVTRNFSESLSHAEMALQFALSVSGVSAVLVGMKNLENVTTNLKSLHQKNLDALTIQMILKSLSARH